LTIRAKVIGVVPVEAVEFRVGDNDWVPMMPLQAEREVWQAPVERCGVGIAIQAREASGATDGDQIEPASPAWAPPARAANGSGQDRVGAWPKKFIPDTQLGANRDGGH
jgi:hypothetical protein